MTYTKETFVRELRKRLILGYDPVEIARWTYSEFLEHCSELEDGMQQAMMQIIAMEEGPEFEMTEAELLAFLE